MNPPSSSYTLTFNGRSATFEKGVPFTFDPGTTDTGTIQTDIPCDVESATMSYEYNGSPVSLALNECVNDGLARQDEFPPAPGEGFEITITWE